MFSGGSFFAIILHMVRLSFLSHRSPSALHAEQMKLCLFCLWLRVMFLAKKQGNAFDITEKARAQLEADWAQLHATWQKAGIAAEVLAQQDPVEAAFHEQHAKLQTLLAANTTQDRALQGLTGEHITGDLLTATVWGYFASLQSYGTIAASQAELIDLPGLSYGVFHVDVKPNRLYGIVTTGVSFLGLNIDMGHMRYVRWVKDDDPQSAVNSAPELSQSGRTAAHNRWIAYNRMRGQHSSAMEHAVLEAFWIDRSQCRYVDENGQTKNPTLSDCGQAVSTVKALAIAQQQGQKIYTITPQNASTALAKLPVSGSVGQEIRNAVQAGKEVTVHEKSVSAYGGMGYGYSIVDPETGAGAYVIEGGGNGGLLLILTGMLILLVIMQLAPFLVASSAISVATMVVIAGALMTAALALLHGNETLCSAAMSTALTGLNTFLKLPVKDPIAAVLIPIMVFSPARSVLGEAICKG
jgi:hypothetical protein